jgi:hypothetical protein
MVVFQAFLRIVYLQNNHHSTRKLPYEIYEPRKLDSEHYSYVGLRSNRNERRVR